jgi:hypothetical protein
MDLIKYFSFYNRLTNKKFFVFIIQIFIAAILEMLSLGAFLL